MNQPRSFSHVIGIDDAPFSREHRGDIQIVGVVHSNARLEGVLSTSIRRDGINSTRAISAMIKRSRYAEHLQAILLQGIALGGFNVVDIHKLQRWTDLPVLVVVRKMPDMKSVQKALVEKVPGGAKKWRLIEAAGALEKVGDVFVQRAGISLEEARLLCEKFAFHSNLPEPLRAAHIIAGGVTLGQSSKGRA
jgi:endonuclease V-like protein UPF0215 family